MPCLAVARGVCSSMARYGYRYGYGYGYACISSGETAGTLEKVVGAFQERPGARSTVSSARMLEASVACFRCVRLTKTHPIATRSSTYSTETPSDSAICWPQTIQ